MILLYGLTVPIIFGLLSVADKSFGLGGLRNAAVMSVAAIVCDVVVFTQMPWVYGVGTGQMYLVGSWLLWGVGVTLTTAIYLN